MIQVADSSPCSDEKINIIVAPVLIENDEELAIFIYVKNGEIRKRL